jgi:hypothetical protein
MAQINFGINYMKRFQFIQSLGLGTGGIILPVNSFIQQQPTKIYDNYVKGLTQYQFNRMEVFAPLVMPSQKLIQMVGLELRADDAADFYRNGY